MATATTTSKPKTSKKSAAEAKAKKPRVPKPIRKHHHVPRGPHGGMQLLLTSDVAHLGQAGDVVEVKMGYGRNFLLPRGFATYVTDHNLRLLELHKIKIEKMREAKLADLRALAAQLASVTVAVEANANEEGHLYGSVTGVEIARCLKQQHHLHIEPEMVHLEGVIKELGLYGIKVILTTEPQIESEIKVLVISATVVPAPEKK